MLACRCSTHVAETNRIAGGCDEWSKCKDDDLHDFKQISSDSDGANADLCVPRRKAVHEMDFFGVDLCTVKTLLKS